MVSTVVRIRAFWTDPEFLEGHVLQVQKLFIYFLFYLWSCRMGIQFAGVGIRSLHCLGQDSGTGSLWVVFDQGSDPDPVFTNGSDLDPAFTEGSDPDPGDLQPEPQPSSPAVKCSFLSGKLDLQTRDVRSHTGWIFGHGSLIKWFPIECTNLFRICNTLLTSSRHL